MSKKKKKKKPEVKPPICPVCGRAAKLVTAKELFGDEAIDPERMLWVCPKYDLGCETYVYTQKGTNRPLGEMATAEVRSLRIKAHRAIDRVIKSGVMTKADVYDYLSDAMDVPKGRFHLAECGEYGCRETIRLMNKVLNNTKRAAAR